MNEFRLSCVFLFRVWSKFSQFLRVFSSKNVSIFFFPHVTTLLSACTKYKRERKNLSSLCERLKERRDTRVEEERYPRPKRAVNARTVLKAREKEEQKWCSRLKIPPDEEDDDLEVNESSSDTKRRNETFILRKERRGRERNNASAMCARRCLIDHPVWSDACAFTRTRDRIKMCDVCCDKALFVILWLFESPRVRIHAQKEKKPCSSAMSARSVLLHLIVWKGTSPLNSSCSFVVLKVYDVHTHAGNLLLRGIWGTLHVSRKLGFRCSSWKREIFSSLFSALEEVLTRTRTALLLVRERSNNSATINRARTVVNALKNEQKQWCY